MNIDFDPADKLSVVHSWQCAPLLPLPLSTSRLVKMEGLIWVYSIFNVRVSLFLVDAIKSYDNMLDQKKLALYLGEKADGIYRWNSLHFYKAELQING